MILQTAHLLAINATKSIFKPLQTINHRETYSANILLKQSL